MGGVLSGITSVPEALKLLLEGLELANACTHVTNVRVQQQIHITTRLGR